MAVKLHVKVFAVHLDGWRGRLSGRSPDWQAILAQPLLVVHQGPFHRPTMVVANRVGPVGRSFAQQLERRQTH